MLGKVREKFFLKKRMNPVARGEIDTRVAANSIPSFNEIPV